MDSTLAFGTVIAAAVSVLFLLLGSHIVPEGHVGVYWRFGRLLTDVSSPGLHFTYPVLTRWEAIQTTIQTDKVKNIPCGTKGGAVVTFEHIEVVNRLRKEAVYDVISQYGTQYDKTWIYDKVHHEMNQFCSANTLQEVYIEKFSQIDEIMQQALQEGCQTHAKGIDIVGVRVTKPKIPDAVLRNYEAMEEQRTKSMVAEVTRELVSIEGQTQKLKELLEAEIRIKKEALEAEAQLTLNRIENQMRLETQRAETDAAAYRTQQEAAANKKLYSKEYLSQYWAKVVREADKVYFGPSLESLANSFNKMASSTFGIESAT